MALGKVYMIISEHVNCSLMTADEGSIHGEEERSEPSPQAAAKSRAASQMDPASAFWSSCGNPGGQGKCWKRYESPSVTSGNSAEVRGAPRSGHRHRGAMGGQAASGRPSLGETPPFAAEQGLDGIAAVFRRALSEELGAPPPLPTPGALSIKNEDERDLVSALLEVLRQERMPSKARP